MAKRYVVTDAGAHAGISGVFYHAGAVLTLTDGVAALLIEADLVEVAPRGYVAPEHTRLNGINATRPAGEQTEAEG